MIEIIQKKNVYNEGNYDIMAMAVSPSTLITNDASLFYLKHNYYLMWRDHFANKSKMGDCTINMTPSGKMIARIYTHDNYFNLTSCNYEALTKAITYLGEIYSDKVVAYSKKNLMGSVGGAWDMILYILESVYENNDINCLVFE